jgi:hypothetical protein
MELKVRHFPLRNQALHAQSKQKVEVEWKDETNLQKLITGSLMIPGDFSQVSIHTQQVPVGVRVVFPSAVGS